MPTAWRTLDEIARGGERALGKITTAVNATRRRAWAGIAARHGALPGIRVADKATAYGPDNPWYRRATASGAGRIRAGSIERDVSFAHAAPEAQTDIDAAYHAEYDRYGLRIVGPVTGSGAYGVTVRLAPQPDREK